MHTKGNDHPQGTHYAITGHEPNPAMHFPSLGSIIAKETGPRNGIPPNVLAPQWERARQYEEYFRSGFLGPDYDPMCIPDPSKKDFRVADLSLPKSVSEQAVHSRKAFLDIVDNHYRTLYAGAEQAAMDGFREQAWKMLLNPAVQQAFDLGKEPDKLRDRYGRDAVGQSALLARRLVEAGARFVTAAGFHSNSWDTHSKNDEGHRDRLCPSLDRTLAALLDDLSERGLLESTVVLAMGEFGRTPFVNPDRGRDHWPTCWSLVLGGGGIKGGQVVGASDENGANPVSSHTSMGNVLRRSTRRLASTGRRNTTPRSDGPSRSRIRWMTPRRSHFGNCCEYARHGAPMARAGMASYRFSLGLLFSQPRRPAGGLHLVSRAAKRFRL
jgi:Protein of unknown function (DUF1501)